MRKEDVLVKLKDRIIGRDTHPHLPRSLDGEILLEEHRGPAGELLGIVTVTVDRLAGLNHEADAEDLLGYKKYGLEASA